MTKKTNKKQTKKPAQRPRKRGFLTASSYAQTVQSTCFKKYGFAQTNLLIDWDQIVGEHWAEFTQPLKLTRSNKMGGTLYLGIPPAHALEAQHILPMLLERINTYYGYRAIKRIMLKQVQLPKKEPITVKSSKKLSKNQEIALKKTLEPIQNERLKAALSKMGTHILSSS